MVTRLAQVQALAASQRYLSPIAETLGIETVSIEAGKVVLALETDVAKHANPPGTVHGGVFSDLADMAMGVAFTTTVEEDESITTIELKINYLKPVWNDRLTATATVIKKGSTVGLITCDVHDSKGSLVAYATSTCMILRGDKMQGR